MFARSYWPAAYWPAAYWPEGAEGPAQPAEEQADGAAGYHGRGGVIVTPRILDDERNKPQAKASTRSRRPVLSLKKTVASVTDEPFSPMAWSTQDDRALISEIRFVEQARMRRAEEELLLFVVVE